MNWTSCFGGMNGWSWGMGFGGFFMILFWAVIIIGAVVLIRWLVDQSKDGKTALQILQERYARGELQREEYEQKKRDLTA
jgi:putative membrane protein